MSDGNNAKCSKHYRIQWTVMLIIFMYSYSTEIFHMLNDSCGKFKKLFYLNMGLEKGI